MSDETVKNMGSESLDVEVARLIVKQDAMKETLDRFEKSLEKILSKIDSLSYVTIPEYEKDKAEQAKQMRRLIAWTVGAATSFGIAAIMAIFDIAIRHNK